MAPAWLLRKELIVQRLNSFDHARLDQMLVDPQPGEFPTLRRAMPLGILLDPRESLQPFGQRVMASAGKCKRSPSKLHSSI